MKNVSLSEEGWAHTAQIMAACYWFVISIIKENKCLLELHDSLKIEYKTMGSLFQKQFNPINYRIVLIHTLKPNLLQLTIYDCNKF